MKIQLANGQTEQLNDIVNLDYFVSRSVSGSTYFSPRNAKIWKSKVTHFCKNSGYFRERIKDASGNGFTYKIGRIHTDGDIETVVLNLTSVKSLQLFKSFQEPKPVI